MTDNNGDTVLGDHSDRAKAPIETPMSPEPNSDKVNDSNRTTAKLDSLVPLSPAPQLMEPQMSPSPTKPSSFGSSKRTTSKLDASTILLSPGAGSLGAMEEPSPIKASSMRNMSTDGTGTGAAILGAVNSPSLTTSPKPVSTEKRTQSLMMLSPAVGGSPTLMEPSPLQGTRGTVINRPQSMVITSPTITAGGSSSGANLEPSPFRPGGTSSTVREGLMGAVEPPSVVGPSVNEKSTMRVTRRTEAANNSASNSNTVPGAVHVDGVTAPSVVEPSGGKSGMRITRRVNQAQSSENVVRPGAVRVDGPGDGNGDGGENVVSSQHQVVTSTSRRRANPISSSSSSKKQQLVGGPAVVPGAVSMPSSVVSRYDNAISNKIKSNDNANNSGNNNGQFQGMADGNDNNSQFQPVTCTFGPLSSERKVLPWIEFQQPSGKQVAPAKDFSNRS